MDLIPPAAVFKLTFANLNNEYIAAVRNAFRTGGGRYLLVPVRCSMITGGRFGKLATSSSFPPIASI